MIIEAFWLLSVWGGEIRGGYETPFASKGDCEIVADWQNKDRATEKHRYECEFVAINMDGDGGDELMVDLEKRGIMKGASAP